LRVTATFEKNLIREGIAADILSKSHVKTNDKKAIQPGKILRFDRKSIAIYQD
jgi:hypothetical protein